MKIVESYKHVPAQLTILALAAAALLALSFMPTSRAAISSSESRFSEISEHGLNIVPASCASNPGYFHANLTPSGDGLGYSLPNTGGVEYGAFATNAGLYVCVTNSSANTYFIPAKTAGEINNFKAYPPSGVVAN